MVSPSTENVTRCAERRSICARYSCRAYRHDERTACTFGGGGLLSCCAGNFGSQKETYPFDAIFPLTKLEFEGKQYYAPGNWDFFLKKFYGDYMELPPEENRGLAPIEIVFDEEKNERGIVSMP